MHQFGPLSERGGNFSNLLQKEEDTLEGRGEGGFGGVPQKRRGSNRGGNCAGKLLLF